MEVVAIDGPAASGKSSVSQAVAERMGWHWVSSGAFYRAWTWILLKEEIPPEDAAIRSIIEIQPLKARIHSREVELSFHGHFIHHELFSDPVNQAVAVYARIQSVRDVVTESLRDLAGRGPCVVEGRDIGTEVFPTARWKFFLDAPLAVRERRRRAQGITEGIADRDRCDSTRSVAPMKAAKDAFVIDTSEASIEGIASRICALVTSSRGLD